jgi:hypothetical protein
MLDKQLTYEMVKNLLEWGLSVSIGAFTSMTLAPYWTGNELSNLEALCGGLLFDRAFASFVFFYNRTHVRETVLSGG